MSVVFIGAPGSGKSTIGRQVAERLDRPFVDVDQAIVDATGREISDIFSVDGEARFRELECEHTLGVLAGPDAIVALGGGAVMTDAIREALEGHTVVWLDVPVPVLADRVGLNAARPLLFGNVRGRLVQLLRERLPVYEACATHRVDASAETGEVVDAVLTALETTR